MSRSRGQEHTMPEAQWRREGNVYGFLPVSSLLESEGTMLILVKKKEPTEIVKNNGYV